MGHNFNNPPCEMILIRTRQAGQLDSLVGDDIMRVLFSTAMNGIEVPITIDLRLFNSLLI